MAGSAGHLAAALGAAPALLRATAHLVAVEPLAGLGAAITGLGADTAGVVVERRAAEHEVSARVADVGAVEQRPDVLSGGVLAAFVQAVDDRRQADVVAVGAAVNAVVHRERDVLGLEVVALALVLSLGAISPAAFVTPARPPLLRVHLSTLRRFGEKSAPPRVARAFCRRVNQPAVRLERALVRARYWTLQPRKGRHLDPDHRIQLPGSETGSKPPADASRLGARATVEQNVSRKDLPVACIGRCGASNAVGRRSGHPSANVSATAPRRGNACETRGAPVSGRRAAFSP